jgi:valyl-tRNA synthetase
VLDTLLRLLHPVIPFVTEALWQVLTQQESLVVADWPSPSGIELNPVAEQRITDMQKLVTEIRRFRSDQGLANRQKVPARLSGVDGADVGAQVGAVTSLAWLTKSGPEFSPSASLEVGLKGGIVVVELDTSGTIDVAAERRRLEKDLAAAQKELASTTKKLGNTDFMAKAPPAEVDKQRERQRVAREETDRITARLAGLQ